MRFTPAQIGMLQLLGARLPMSPEQSIEGRIRSGHTFLVELTGQDFGFAPEPWHDHLRATNAGGYRWSNKHLGIPRRITTARANADWQQAIKNLESAQPNVAVDGSSRSSLRRR